MSRRKQSRSKRFLPCCWHHEGKQECSAWELSSPRAKLEVRCATTGSKWLSCGKVWNMIAGTQDSQVELSTSGVCARADHAFLRSPMAFHPPTLLPYTTMQIDEVPLRSLIMHFPFVLPRLQQTHSLCKANNNKPSHSNLIPFLSCPILSCPILSCPILSYPVLSRKALPYTPVPAR
jgi:hypothetical protein